MATISILGSGSNGNCYLIETKDSKLILELGFTFSEIKEFMRFNFDNCFALVSHEHGDHAKGMKKALNMGINVLSSLGTFKAYGLENHVNSIVLKEGKIFKIMGFSIIPFLVNHDCNEPFNYLIKHPEFGTLLFITDTCEVEYTFKNLNHIIIEANYCKNIIRSNPDIVYANRIIKSHLSIDNCLEFLGNTDLSNVKTVTLCHLSDRNSNKTEFKKMAMELTGIPVFIAEENLKYNLN